jgi:branched-subunit amino acid transport protein
MRALGRFLQFVGLIVLPLALVLSMLPSRRGDEKLLSTGQELMALVLGAAVFWIGRLLEGYAKR